MDSIAVVGDSIVWGYGVSDSETVTYFLQGLAGELNYQVHNLGVSGYGIGQYYLYLKRHIASLPRLRHVVLVIFPFNDLLDTESNSRYGKRKQRVSLKGTPTIGIPEHQNTIQECLT